MPYSSGDPNAFVAVGMQSALGTPQTGATKLRFLKYLSGTDVSPEISVQDLREGGDGLDYGFTYKDKQVVRGQLVFNARPEAAGQVLEIALGGATWDGGSGPAIHTFHTGHASFPWATLFVQHPGSALPHFISDARFTGVTIEGNAGQPWKFTVPFIGINHGASFAALTPTYYGDEPFLYHGNPTFVLDGVADTDISSFRVAIGYGVDEIQAQGLTLDEIPVMNRTIDAEVTRRFENPYQWQHIYYGASANVTPTYAVATGALRVDSLYGAGAALRSIQIQVPLLSYRGNKLTELDPDGKTVMETMSARALKGASTAAFVVLKNAHASAYVS